MNRTDLAVRNKNLFAEYQILWKIEKEKAESVKTKHSRNAVNQQLAVKDNLAISLQKRFLYWLIFCPIWLVGVLG